MHNARWVTSKIIKAILYEILVFSLLFLLSWLWFRRPMQSVGFTLTSFVIVTMLYFAYDVLWSSAVEKGIKD